MRIAFIVGVFPSLTETFILNQITGLIDMGHEVEIFSKDRSAEKKKHKSIEQYKLMENVRFFPQLPQNKLFRILKGKILFLMNFFKDPARLWRSINIFSGDKDILSLKVLYYLIPFAGREFDIVYSHFGHNGIIGVYLKKAGITSKFVTTFHGYDLSVFLHLNGQSVYSQLFRHTDLCLPISRYWEQKLVEIGCPAEKIKVHRMGINIESGFEKDDQKNREVLKILTVGRLVEKKGHRYSIQAVVELLDQGENLEYIIAGGGPLLGELKKYVQKPAHEEKIRFTGECTNSEVMEFYNQSDVFILHSVTSEDQDKEGIPVVLMEAMMKGLPVISTFHSGIPELVKNGESGFLVKEKDVTGMKNSIKILLRNRELCLSMGKKGRKIVSEEYNIEFQNKKIENIFSELLAVKSAKKR